MILALDSGTTRTRVWALDEARPPFVGGSELAGARDLARARDRSWLAERVVHAAQSALESAGALWVDVEVVVAFGMITSELGLVEVPHLSAPVSPLELAESLTEAPEFLPAPTLLVPGVRTDGELLEEADVMRGEETEVVGLLSLAQIEPPLLYISPGSHCKFVGVDASGRIAWSMTTLSGELLWALHKETILADLIEVDGEELDPAWVAEGARVVARSGLTRSLFVGRLANRLVGATPAACSAFLHAAAAETDLGALEAARSTAALPPTVVLAGSGPLCDCYRLLLDRREWAREIHVIDQPLGAIGARALYEARTRARKEGRPLRA